MAARRRRPANMSNEDRRDTKVSERITRQLSDSDEEIPTQDSPNPTNVSPEAIVVLESDLYTSESNESDEDSVQIGNPTPEDAGYNADAEDADDRVDDVGYEEEDENNEDGPSSLNRSDVVDDHTDNDYVSPHEQGDDADAIGQSDSVENDETGAPYDSEEEQMSNGEETREEADEREVLTNARFTVDERNERISESEDSNDEGESEESSPVDANNLQNVEEFIDESEDGVEEEDEGDQIVIDVTEGPRGEEELPDARNESSKDEDTLEFETADSSPGYEEADGNDEDVLDYGDPTSPHNVETSDCAEEVASEGEEHPEEINVAQLVQPMDNHNDDEDEPNDVEPADETDEDSDLGERAEERNSDDEENEEHLDINELEEKEEQANENEEDDDRFEKDGDENLTFDDKNDAGEASADNITIDQQGPEGTNNSSDGAENEEELINENEIDEDDIVEEEEDAREVISVKSASDSGDDADEESGVNAVQNQVPARADDSSDDAEKAEGQVDNSGSDDAAFGDEDGDVIDEIGDKKDDIDDGDEDESYEMEDSDDDDVNTRTYKVVPPILPDSIMRDKDVDIEVKASKDAKDTNDVGNGSKSDKQKLNRLDTKIERGDSKSGVIYVSRVPPGLDVTALRSLLSRVTQTKRIWLRAETKEQRRRRQSLGGSRRKERFRDGWVEVSSSKEARRVVGLLNGRAMTAGKRKGRWADDLWCLKYLKGFRWDDLTQEVFGGRERVLKVRESVMQGRRERAWIEGRGKGSGEKVRRFRQKRVFEDLDEVRAWEAGQKVDDEIENGGRKGVVDEELVEMLFKKRKI